VVVLVVVAEAVRNNGTRNGCLAAIMHCCRREECSLAHSPTLSLPSLQAGREAFLGVRLVLALCVLCRPLVALIRSPSPISS
jgi:hypothetical protein